MVKIETLEEFKRIQESDFGFIISLNEKSVPTIHKTNCESLKEEDFVSSLKNKNELKFHWFSSFSLAEKELGEISSCKNCNA